MWKILNETPKDLFVVATEYKTTFILVTEGQCTLVNDTRTYEIGHIPSARDILEFVRG